VPEAFRGFRDCVPCPGLYFGLNILIPVMAAIETPCNKVCIVEHNSGQCLGCGRTLGEIANWTGLTDGERSRIMAELPRRVESMRRRDAKATVP
jgi:uncharacterized protein